MSRPFVTLKLATSLDGRIATASGESRWITSERARLQVHAMRANEGFVMIGAGTARADDPSLLVRSDPTPLRQPNRVVVTTDFDIPAGGRLFENLEQSALLVFGAEGADGSRRAALESAGARLEAVPRHQAGLDLAAVLERVAAFASGGVLAEGGGGLAASLLAAELVDRIEWFRAPIVLGAEGRPAISALGIEALVAAPRFQRVALRELGPDIWESYVPAS